jgi:hypothetical protein
MLGEPDTPVAAPLMPKQHPCSNALVVSDPALTEELTVA